MNKRQRKKRNKKVFKYAQENSSPFVVREGDTFKICFTSKSEVGKWYPSYELMEIELK